MLARFFKIFELKEKDLSRRALLRFRIFTILAIPVFPLFTLIELGNLSQSATKTAMVVGIISFIFFCIVGLSRIANRFWTPNRYMDEWEIQLKQSSMSFAYQLIFIGVVASVLVLISVGWIETEAVLFEFKAHQLVWALANIFVMMLFLPLIYIIWALRPIDVDDRDTELRGAWYKKPGMIAAAIVALCFVSYFGVIIADAIHDTNYDYAAQCEGSSVKSAKTAGLFKVDVECFE